MAKTRPQIAGAVGILALGVGSGGAGCGLLLGLDEFVDAPAGTGGGGGATTASGGPCDEGVRDCVGDTPRECAGGDWVPQAPCSGGTPVCAGGACVACAEGERGCAASTPQRCEGGAWVPETPCANPAPGCRDGECVPPSCAGGGPGAGLSCGPTGTADCCGSMVVPGGTFDRSNDPMYPATVSDFRLDTYEITVGRFRAFVEAGKGTQADPPMPGGGAHPTIPFNYSGWNEAWITELPMDTATLRAALKCGQWTWTDAPGPNENRPISCLTWHLAFAFCIWDGGRLPTEAEWNYAAAGGSEQRAYPWGSRPDADQTLASYDCLGDGECTAEDARPAGSYSPQGDGRWGHSDLAGGLQEWLFDYWNTPYGITSCVDCAYYVGGPGRGVRGGSAFGPSSMLFTMARNWQPENSPNSTIGARCARLP